MDEKLRNMIESRVIHYATTFWRKKKLLKILGVVNSFDWIKSENPKKRKGIVAFIFKNKTIGTRIVFI